MQAVGIVLNDSPLHRRSLTQGSAPGLNFGGFCEEAKVCVALNDIEITEHRTKGSIHERESIPIEIGTII